MRKVSGIDALVDKVVDNLPGLSQVWICGALARGIQGDSIDCVLIGTDLNSKYIAGLSARVKELTGKKVNTQVLEQMPDEKREQCLLVWEKRANNDCPVAGNFNSKQQRKTSTGHACDIIIHGKENSSYWIRIRGFAARG